MEVQVSHEQRRVQRRPRRGRRQRVGVPASPPARSDRRALTGEVWVLGQNELHSFFPTRDHYAEELVLQYNILYTPVDSIISDGKAVTEFLKRFRKFRSKNVAA